MNTIDIDHVNEGISIERQFKVEITNTFLDHFVFSCFTFEGLTNVFFNDRCTVINAFIANHTS